MGVPIFSKERLIGALYLTDKPDGSEFTEADQQLIEMLAIHAAIAIENARSMQQVLERHKKEMADHKKEVEEIWDWFDSTYNYPRILDG